MMESVSSTVTGRKRLKYPAISFHRVMLKTSFSYRIHLSHTHCLKVFSLSIYVIQDKNGQSDGIKWMKRHDWLIQSTTNWSTTSITEDKIQKIYYIGKYTRLQRSSSSSIHRKNVQNNHITIKKTFKDSKIPNIL